MFSIVHIFPYFVQRESWRRGRPGEWSYLALAEVAAAKPHGTNGKVV